jgi:hypothetical protein
LEETGEIPGETLGSSTRKHHVFFFGSTPLTLGHPYLVGGLEHLDYDFPFSWECHHPNCYSLHIFQRGRAKNHQPVIIAWNTEHKKTPAALLQDLHESLFAAPRMDLLGGF